MSYRDKIRSLLKENISISLFELHDFTNYTRFQGTKAIPLMAKRLNISPEEFLKRPDVAKFLKGFRDAAVERFGVDENGKPNSSVEDDPRWDIKNPASEELANELIDRIFQLQSA